MTLAHAQPAAQPPGAAPTPPEPAEGERTTPAAESAEKTAGGEGIAASDSMAGPTHSFDPAASPDRAPHGAALAVAPPDARAPLGEALAHVGYAPAYVDDPYALVLELSRRPLAFRAVVLSLAALYPAELRVIETIKARFGHVETIVTDADGRAAALAEAVRLGADALLEHGRLHRLAPSVPAGGQPEPRPPARPQTPRHRPLEPPESGAVLSPEEIRALLEEPPAPST